MERTPSFNLEDLGNDFSMEDAPKVGRGLTPRSLVNAMAGAAFLANSMALPAVAAAPRFASGRDQGSVASKQAELPTVSELSALKVREVAIIPFAAPLLIWAYGEFFRKETQTVVETDGYIELSFSPPSDSEAKKLLGDQLIRVPVPNKASNVILPTDSIKEKPANADVIIPIAPAYAFPKMVWIRFNSGVVKKVSYKDLIQDSKGRQIVRVVITEADVINGQRLDVKATVEWGKEDGAPNVKLEDTTVGFSIWPDSIANLEKKMLVDNANKNGDALEILTPVTREKPDDLSGQDHELRKNSSSIVKLTNTGSTPARVRVTDGVVDSPNAIEVTVPAGATATVRVKEGSVAKVEDASFDPSPSGKVDMSVLHLKPQGTTLENAILRDSKNNLTNQFTIQKGQTFEWNIRESARALQSQLPELDDEQRLQGMIAQAGIAADVPTLRIKSTESLSEKDFLPYGEGKGWGGAPDLGPINGPGQPLTSVDLGAVKQKVEKRLQDEPTYLEKMVSTLLDSDRIMIDQISAIAESTNSTPHKVRAKLAKDLLIHVKEKAGSKGMLPKGTKFARLTAGTGSTENRIIAHEMPAAAYVLIMGDYRVVFFDLGECGNWTADIIRLQKPKKPPVVVTPPIEGPEILVTALPPLAKPKMPMVGEVYAKDTVRTVVSRPAMAIPVFPSETNVNVTNGNNIDVAGSTATAAASAEQQQQMLAQQQQQQSVLNNTMVEILLNKFNLNLNGNTNTNTNKNGPQGADFEHLDEQVSLKPAIAEMFANEANASQVDDVTWILPQSFGKRNRATRRSSRQVA